MTHPARLRPDDTRTHPGSESAGLAVRCRGPDAAEGLSSCGGTAGHVLDLEPRDEAMLNLRGYASDLPEICPELATLSNSTAPVTGFG